MVRGSSPVAFAHFASSALRTCFQSCASDPDEIRSIQAATRATTEDVEKGDVRVVRAIRPPYKLFIIVKGL
jgi:hypothetical protein